LFNDKKKARPAGQKLSASAELESAATPTGKVKGRDAQGHVPYKGENKTHPAGQKPSAYAEIESATTPNRKEPGCRSIHSAPPTVVSV